MLISGASHFVSYSSCWRSDKPWEIFTLSQRKSSQPCTGADVEWGRREARHSAEDE